MRLVALSVFALTLGIAGCDQAPVEWHDPVELAQAAGHSHLVFEGGTPRFVVDSNFPTALPESHGRCPTVASITGLEESAAAWWSVRPDSSAVLYLSASPDSGRTWGTPTAVDTSDVSSNGCLRPLPALATVGDDVYVAYSMVASEGTGVFFAHTMSGMVHSPVPVIYGDRLVATALVADAKRVIVAYEEPNGSRERINLAISASQGHLFETHTAASRTVDNATAPVLALSDSMLAISWLTRGATDTSDSRIVRVGRMTSWK